MLHWDYMFKSRVEYDVYLIKVQADKCDGCDKCRVACPVDVFKIQDNIAVAVNPKSCFGCGACAAVCEKRAIILTEL